MDCTDHELTVLTLALVFLHQKLCLLLLFLLTGVCFCFLLTLSFRFQVLAQPLLSSERFHDDNNPNLVPWLIYTEIRSG